MKKVISILVCVALIFSLSSIAFALKASKGEILNGIDVSRYQGEIDFKKVKQSGIDIVYIRSSLGSSYVDPYLNQNYANAKSAGLKVGFYHFVTAENVLQAQNQAQFFVSTIAGKEPDCKLAVDFEEFKSLTKSQINEITLAFAQKVEELSKKEVVIYANAYTASSILQKELTKYPLWVAHWDVAKPSDSVLWSEWVGWQYTSKGTVNGINTLVDKDYFTSDIFLANSSAVPQKPDDENKKNYYVVQKGDTLWAIAIKYGTTVSSIVNLNSIKNPNLIYAGQRLLIKNLGNTTNQYVNYVVKKGDTLWAIAKRYNTSVSKIASDNNIKNPNLIYAGQNLKIFSSSALQKPPQTSQKMTSYTIKKGDTLWAIAKRYNTSVSKIASDNNIKNPNLIYAGKTLKIVTK